MGLGRLGTKEFKDPQQILAVGVHQKKVLRLRDMVTRIVKEDTAARDRLIEIWNGMRSSNFNEASLLEYVGQTQALLEESQQLNFKRWKILNEQVHQNYQALGSYSAEVYVIKNYIRQRLTTLDGLIRNK